MPQTDTPFKLLVSEFAPDFAAWLLDVDEADVRRVQPLNIELPAGAVRIDTAFRVTLADGRVTLLHRVPGAAQRTADALAHARLPQPVGAARIRLPV